MPTESLLIAHGSGDGFEIGSGADKHEKSPIPEAGAAMSWRSVQATTRDLSNSQETTAQKGTDEAEATNVPDQQL